MYVKEYGDDYRKASSRAEPVKNARKYDENVLPVRRRLGFSQDKEAGLILTYPSM